MLKRLLEETLSKILFFNFFSLMNVMQISINDSDITDHSKNAQPSKEKPQAKEDNKPEEKKKIQFGNLFGKK